MFIRIPEEFCYRTRQINTQFIPEAVLQTIKPPDYIPDESMLKKLKKPGEPTEIGAVDAPILLPCIYQFVWIDFTGPLGGEAKKGNWIILTYVGAQSIGGYSFVWGEPPHWTYRGYSADKIAAFYCSPIQIPEILPDIPVPPPWL